MNVLPVAELAVNAEGRTVGAICPACGKVIEGKGPFQTAERYAAHYHREHRSNDDHTNEVPEGAAG